MAAAVKARRQAPEGPTPAPNVLSPAQIAFFWEHGWVRIPKVFNPKEVEELTEDLDWLIATWAERIEWTGSWRKQLMDKKTEKMAKIDAMHDLQHYSQAWARAVAKPKLAGAMSDLLGGGPVELHHSTMHVKPPESGMPFPMHQDYAFYQHLDNRYVDVLVHLDDTCHENGEIRFLDGSHKNGALDHINVSEGKFCTPHLSQAEYRLEDSVAVPAKAGDVVCFNLHTIHGSHINRTDKARRLVRIGYRHPDNTQIAGQSVGRTGPIVWGRRARSGAAPSYHAG